MAIDFSYNPEKQSSGDIDFSYNPAAGGLSARAKKQNKGFLADTATDAKRGIEQLPGMATGLVDLVNPLTYVTGKRMADEAANWVGEKTGFQPSKWEKQAAEEYSPERKASDKVINDAWENGSASDIAGSYLSNPRSIAGVIGQSAPSMLAGGGIARLGLKSMAAIGGTDLAALRASAAAGDVAAADKLNRLATTAGAVGEGAVTAGQNMDQVSRDVDPALAAGTSLAAGAITGLIGKTSGRVANKLGIPDFETSMAGGGAGTGSMSLSKRIAAGATQEGLLQEAPQSAQEQMWQNVAEGKPLGEGVARQAVEGTLAGIAMGGGIALRSGNKSAPKADDTKPAAEEVPPAALGLTYQPGLIPGVDVGEQKQATIPASDMPVVDFQKSPVYGPTAPVSRADEMQGIDFTPEPKLQETGPMSSAVNVGVDSGATSLRPQGSFSNMSEFANLLGQEQQDVQSRRTGIAGRQALQREVALQDADQRVADQMAKEAAQRRRAVLDQVLSDPNTQNPAERFAAELKRQGFRDSTPTADELATVQRFNDIKAAQPAGPEIEPSLPNELDAEQLGIRSRKGSSGAQSSGRDKVAEVRQLVADGWKISNKTLVSPTGKKRILNTAEHAAAKEATRERNLSAMERYRQSKGKGTPAAESTTNVASEETNAPEPAQMAAQTAQANDAQAESQSSAASSIKKLQAELEKTDPFTSRSSKLIEKLQNAVTNDAQSALDSGEIPVYKVTDHVSVAVHPSAQNPGKIQVTRYTNDGVIGDSQYNSIGDAVRQEGLTHKPRISSVEAVAHIEKSIAAEAEYQSRKSESKQAAPAVTQSDVEDYGKRVVRRKKGNEARDDLVGAIMRVTGGNGVAASMSQTITGDTANRASKVRGLFTNNGTMDLDDIANDLRTEEGYDVRDGNHLAELIREQAAGNPVYSMERNERDAAANEEKKQKDAVLKQANELGLKGVGGKRTLAVVEAEIAKVEAERNELEKRQERAAIQAEAIAEKLDSDGLDLTEADLMSWLGSIVEYTQDDINEANSRASEIASRRAETNAIVDSEGQAQSSGGERAKDGSTQEGARSNQGFDLTKQTNEQAAEQFAQQNAPESDQVSKEQAGRERDAVPFSMQQESQPKPQGRQTGLFTADGRVSSESKQSKQDQISDFGEKLGGAKKDRIPSLEKTLSDEDIATLPLSKIWPASEIDGVENKFAAAVSYAARNEIPSKPRVSYKVASWVEKVKMLRGIASKIVGIGEDKARELFDKAIQSSDFKSKIRLMEAVDRSQWSRIGKVGEYPNAYRYGEGGEKIVSPSVIVEIDGKTQRFEGAKSISDAMDRINAALSGDAEAKKMQFEVRGRAGAFSINKKGDKEYRKLKTFSTTKEAFDFIKSNYDDLVSAWDGVKGSDNVTKTDIRNRENRPRTGMDRRNGKDVTDKQFQDAFGFRGVEFGNWVQQGANAKERQGMLNQAFDAMHDLAEIVGIPPKAISLNGTLGLGFGSRGSGSASAHFEPGNLVINLTKTRGAGTLAHEWFHALDNYFARSRNNGNQKTMAEVGNSQDEYRRQNFVTYKPERLYVHKTQRSTPTSRADLERFRAANPNSGYFKEENWQADPNHPEGVRIEVESAFSDLVNALNESPMARRSRMIDKGPNGYWSRIIERGARSFENYVISKMMEGGYNNDYLANVREVQDFPRSKERYPYLLPEEVAPISEAFDALFSTIQTKETDKGVAMFSRTSDAFHGVRSFVRSVINGSGAFKFFDFAKVGTDEARKLRDSTGLFLSGYSHSIDENAVRHVMRKHGNMAKEVARGQIGINEDDLAMIPAIVANYDSVSRGANSPDGKPTIVYQKTLGNGVTYYVEEVRTGREKLMAKTMWKVGPAVPRTTSEDGVVHTSETSGSQPDSNVSANGNIRKSFGDSNASRGQGSGMAFRDLQAVVDRVSKGFNNLPKIHVLDSPKDLSDRRDNERTLKEQIEQAGAMDDVEGAHHNGEIYLFASGIASEERAEHVLATHEITHYGLRGTMGKGLDSALQNIWLYNKEVRAKAAVLRMQLGLTSNVSAVEEVLAEMKDSDLVKLKGWRKMVQAFRDWAHKAGFDRIAEKLDGLITKGMSDQEKADLFVANMVNAARDWVRNGKPARGYDPGTSMLGDANFSAKNKSASVDASITEIFDGLAGRGLKKQRAEERLAEHPQAESIRYVQDNILDILEELEGAGTIKINC